MRQAIDLDDQGANKRRNEGEMPGDIIDRYRILKLIGEGGMGVVYLAEQELPVCRRVALKVIKAGMDTKAVIARFEAERQALALMEHPNIARVLDAGTTRNGRPYFVMELVAGVKVTDFCDQHHCRMHERLTLFMQICRAIQHAHQKGIIHRDIKPSNILVTLHEGVPVPKIIDFGVAKAIRDQQLGARITLTGTALFLGTPAYMSPEQTEWNGLDIDTRSDVYSLGVLLYELVTGQPPFDERELLEFGVESLCRTIREKDPPKPSERLSREIAQATARTLSAKHDKSGRPKTNGGDADDVRSQRAKQLIPLVRGDLDCIVMKALEKDRTRRYDTAHGFALDIQRHLANEPVVARPPSLFYRSQKLVRRNKKTFVALAAVALALVFGLAASTWLFFKEKADHQRALQAEAQAKIAAGKSQMVSQFLTSMLKSLDPALAQGRDVTILHEILDKAAQRVADDLESEPEIQAQLRSVIGNAYYEMEDYTRADEQFRKALQSRRMLFGETNALVAASLNDLGNAVTMEDSLPEGESLHRQALAIRRHLFKNPHLAVAESLTSLADTLTDQRNLAEAEALLEEALKIQRALPSETEDRDFKMLTTLRYLGRALRLQGKLAQAEAAHREQVQLARSKTSLDVGDALLYLHGILRDENKLDEAESVCKEAVEARRRLLGEEHPKVSDTRNELAIFYHRFGKLDKAESTVRKALETQTNPFGERHWVVAQSQQILALILRDGGKLTDLETLLSEQLQNMRTWLPTNDVRLVRTLTDLSDVLIRREKFVEAEPLVRECLTLQETIMPGDWHSFNSLSYLGRSLLGQKKYADSEPLLLSAYAGMIQQEEEIYADRAWPRIKDTLQCLVRLYGVLDRPEHIVKWKQKLDDFERSRNANQRATLSKLAPAS